MRTTLFTPSRAASPCALAASCVVHVPLQSSFRAFDFATVPQSDLPVPLIVIHCWHVYRKYTSGRLMAQYHCSSSSSKQQLVPLTAPAFAAQCRSDAARSSIV